jgi:hypothetical protein
VLSNNNSTKSPKIKNTYKLNLTFFSLTRRVQEKITFNYSVSCYMSVTNKPSRMSLYRRYYMFWIYFLFLYLIPDGIFVPLL